MPEPQETTQTAKSPNWMMIMTVVAVIALGSYIFFSSKGAK